MAKVEGVNQVVAALHRARNRFGRGRQPSVIVGYTANYALYVHENMEMKLKGQKRTGKHASGQNRKGRYWDPQGGGQSKFLEQPARENAQRIGKIVSSVVVKTKNFTNGLIFGGLFLQRESMQLVPVDTGNLKASAFTGVSKAFTPTQTMFD